MDPFLTGVKTEKHCTVIVTERTLTAHDQTNRLLVREHHHERRRDRCCTERNAR